MDNPQGTLNATDVEIGWLAGIIDGEGTIAFSVYKAPRYRDIRVKPQVLVCSTNKAITERVVHICGLLGVGAHFSTREGRHPDAFKARQYKSLHVANVSGFKRVKKLLPPIIPHLVDPKGRKAKMVLQYIDQRLEKTARFGRWASIDLQDAILMKSIVAFAAVHNDKGPGSRNNEAIEGLLRDLEQNRDISPG